MLIEFATIDFSLDKRELLGANYFGYECIINFENWIRINHYLHCK